MCWQALPGDLAFTETVRLHVGPGTKLPFKVGWRRSRGRSKASDSHSATLLRALDLKQPTPEAIALKGPDGVAELRYVEASAWMCCATHAGSQQLVKSRSHEFWFLPAVAGSRVIVKRSRDLRKFR